MKRVIVMSMGLATSLMASELQYGSGTFGMKGGFIGLTSEVTTDVESFSLVERHSNFASTMFYGYDLTWYDSTTLSAAQHTYNEQADAFNAGLPQDGGGLSIPSMDYRMKGLDVNLKVGYDVWHENQDNFVGVGVLVGLSMPWIDGGSDDSTLGAVPNFDFYTGNAGALEEGADLFADSETEIMTYKVGPTLSFQKSLMGKKLSLYGLASYAYQTGYIKNDYANSDFTVDGTYQEYGLGLYFTPFTETFKWGWFTLSPRIYATLGYKYSRWDLDDVSIDISGADLSSAVLDPLAMTFTMDTSVGYFGIGYSF